MSVIQSTVQFHESEESEIAQLRRRVAELEARLSVQPFQKEAQAPQDYAQLVQKLRQANEMLDTLFENAPIGIGLWDRQLRYTKVNAALAEINGLPPEVHIGKTVAELLPGVASEVMTALQQVLDTGELVCHETSGETPAAPGQLRYWLVSYYPIRVDGQLVGVGAICEEITRQKNNAEEQSRLLAAQEELNLLKDQFLSVASHDLRTPLTSVRGYAQLLQRNLARQLQNQQLPDLKLLERNLNSANSILRQTERMSELISRLLEFSRIESGKMVLEYTEGADIVALVRQVVERQGMIATHHQLIFESELPQLKADYDAARLEQVLDNLINNALKYSPPETAVTVRVDRPADPAEVVISVRDAGMGISQESQSHLFTRFYRVQTEETRYVDGLGLGLYICAEIIHQHGGRIWLESQPGQGSTFYFSLPLHRLRS